jgi:dTDP-glucose 4,6-dehydratase
MNVIGRMQHYEKYVPTIIRKILLGEELQIHSDTTETKPGSRFYIDARNVANAVRFVLANGTHGDKFNIVGERELDNLQIAKLIEKFIGKKLKYRLVSWHASRPGHDIRYALCDKKMAALGWTPPKSIEQSLEETVQWYLANPEWLGLPSEIVKDAVTSTDRLRVVKNTAAISA